MVEGQNTKLSVDTKECPHSKWFILFEDTCQNLKPSINRQIRVLNLSNIYCFDAVQNDIYIAIYELYISKRLAFNPEDNLFTYIKQNGSQSLILNLEGWLRITIFNHLKRIRKKRNLIEHSLNIDDYKVMCKTSIILYLEFTEIEEKLKKLSYEDRRIIELFYFYDIPYKKIVEIFTQERIGEFSVSTLRGKKERALDKLRNVY